jgi:co-chaperonin GroES (HSP10)
MVTNGNILVKLNETATMDNGIQIQETRGKRDVVSGVVADADEKTGVKLFQKVYFPYYAAVAIQYKGEDLWIVNYQDVIIIDD